MNLSEILQRFEKSSPISVMTRVALANILSDERLNTIFGQHAVRQTASELSFSITADLMALVALKASPSINAAFKYRTREQVGVAIKSIYNKLAGIEPAVSRAMVRETANDLRDTVGHLSQGFSDPILQGFELRIIDGNHFSGTDHRLKELRTLGAAALPAQCVAILDPDKRLMVDMIPCEDAHASECTMIPEIASLARAGEVWMGDRKFGTYGMMFSIAKEQRSHFIFRQNMGYHQTYRELAKEVKVGSVDGGVVYEQDIEMEHQGGTLKLRRLTVKLEQPTRKGDREIYLFSNLPKRVSGKRIAKAYRQRWSIEKAFLHMSQSLHCEISALGYPKAALFSFCMGLMMFNVLSVIKTAIAAAQNEATLVDEISTYYVALEISQNWSGFRLMISDEEFEELYSPGSPKQLAIKLRRLAKLVALERIRKSKRGPKKPPPKKKSGNRGNHVATARLLAERK